MWKVVIGALTVIIVLLSLSIAKIVVGTLHLEDCSIEPQIPRYLIVSGVNPIFLCGFGGGAVESDGAIPLIASGVIGFIFNIAWLILGSVYVYKNFGVVMADGFTPCTGNITTDCTQGDCNRNLLSFAFAMVTLDWVLIVLAGVLIVCFFCFFCKS